MTEARIALIIMGLVVYAFVIAFVWMLAKRSRARDDEYDRLVRHKVEEDERAREHPASGPGGAA